MKNFGTQAICLIILIAAIGCRKQEPVANIAGFVRKDTNALGSELFVGITYSGVPNKPIWFRAMDWGGDTCRIEVGGLGPPEVTCDAAAFLKVERYIRWTEPFTGQPPSYASK